MEVLGGSTIKIYHLKPKGYIMSILYCDKKKQILRR